MSALASNTTGGENTATGLQALFHNTTGVENTADGKNALFTNTTGGVNTAIGYQALFNNTVGVGNTANGDSALLASTTGNSNTAMGTGALLDNTTGGLNVALGAGAGLHATTGSNNVYIGAMQGVAGESNACYIASIYNQLSSGGTQVFVNSNGKLGTTPSSRRFKDNIKPMADASDAILALKPVTFQYKQDPAGIPQFGLVAEDVEAVNSDLVVRDKEGQANSVRYEAVNAMLLNEFLKEHRKVQELAANAAQQEKRIEALTAGLEKVSAQLEASKAAPQVVNNP